MTEKLEEFARFLLETDLPQGKGFLGDPQRGYCCMGAGLVWKNIPFNGNDHLPNVQQAKELGIPSSENNRRISKTH